MDNEEKYRQLTEAADWAGICALNGVALDAFGTKKELGVLREHLEPGEIVFALTSGIVKHSETSNSSDWGSNTWLIALTNERFLFLDCALLTRSVDVQSIRLDRVQAVSSSQGWVLGKVMIDLGSRMAVIDNCQKATVAVIGDLANKLLRERENARSPAPTRGGGPSDDDPIEKLERLAALHASGALTDGEFAAAKGKLLGL
ncbi:PH domain-containing protein [Sphingomonas sediminicola]|uniref:PH domain-containing protein n=1 Tax=Sphingomonas sediminicola TaxID=386874 RepID=A0ABX6T8A3_9SPHN|nr:PH domain-containing protein [Sphingomonas sediminicola]QNP45646.1 PH domain-containing protein [Sphingomonas sediminicola]